MTEPHSSTIYVITSSRRAPTARTAIAKSDYQAPDIDRNVKSVARVFRTAMLNLAASIETPHAKNALRMSSVSKVIAALDWVQFVKDLQPMTKYLAMSIKAQAKEEVAAAHKKPVFLSKAVKAPPSKYTYGQSVIGDPELGLKGSTLLSTFDAIDPLAIAYATKNAGLLIGGITTQAKADIGAMVVNALQGNSTVDKLARDLRSVIPLSQGDAAFVQKYEAQQAVRFLKEGYTLAQAGDKAAALAEQLATKKLNQRATTIARTELVSSSNAGRYAGWTAGVDGGFIDPNSLKQWSAAPDACPECAALDGMLAPWDGTFDNGLDMPPDHPRCRCTAVILPPDPDLIDQMNSQMSSDLSSSDLATAAATGSALGNDSIEFDQ